MIEVTDLAKQELRRIMADKIEHPEGRPRLLEHANGKLGLGVDIEMPGDLVIEDDGLKVLLVAPELAARGTRITLDVEKTPEGTRLVILTE